MPADHRGHGRGKNRDYAPRHGSSGSLHRRGTKSMQRRADRDEKTLRQKFVDWLRDAT